MKDINCGNFGWYISVLLFCFKFAESTKSTKLLLTGDTDYLVGATVKLNVSLSKQLNESIDVTLYCDGDKCSEVFQCNRCANITFRANSTVPAEVHLKSYEVGITTLFVNTNDRDVEFDNAFLDVSIGYSSNVLILSNIVGWIYFVAWSISFYPQVWTNYKRKSVVGLNFDFLSLNLTGFIFYSAFNICLCFIRSFQNEYRAWKPHTNIPVQLNDVGFSVHAVLLTSFTIIQCFLYERGGQRVSIFAILLLIGLWSSAGVLLILVILKIFSQLYYALYFSYAKLGITIFKYTPQAVQNFRRKSTEGWSIGNVLLDFTGGVFSILQMFLLSFNYDDWSNIFGNFTKFGLGMISIIFDIIFIFQHYVLYRNSDGTQSLIPNTHPKNDDQDENGDENRIIS